MAGAAAPAILLKQALDVPIRSTGLLLPGLLEEIRRRPTAAVLFSARFAMPENTGVVSVPLVDPVPKYPWSMVWRRRAQTPALVGLRREYSEIARDRGWLDYDPARDWLAAPDRAYYLHQLTGERDEVYD